MKLNVVVRKPNVKDAFAMLRNNIGMLDWFARNGRPYQAEVLHNLRSDLIEEMIADRHLVTTETYLQFDEKYYERFAAESYPTCNYQPIIEKMESFIPVIEKVSDKFFALHQSWGFKIYPVYYIDLDYFGGGGKYDNLNGCIIFGLKGGEIPSEKSIAMIIHEMIHLGIQDLIINPESKAQPRVPQEEKERIVDNLCVYVLDGILESKRFSLPDGTMSAYQQVAECAAYMDEVVGKQPETNLVEAVESFLNDSEKAKERYISKSET